MTESILDTTKKLLGPTQEVEFFDTDIIVHINNVFSILYDLGIGPDTGFSISDNSTTWEEYIPDNPYVLNMVKDYMYCKTRLYFDPPSNAALLESLKEHTKELEWRLNVKVDTKEKEETKKE